MNQPAEDAPRLIVAFPPLLYLLPFAVLAGIDTLRPAPIVAGWIRYYLAGAFAGAAGLIMPFVLREFHRARTNFDTRRPSTCVISSGPYRYSRNPAYLSLTLLYLGGAVALDSLWVLAGILPAILATHYGVILPEERYLERKFGAEYRRYAVSVRRWL